MPDMAAVVSCFAASTGRPKPRLLEAPRISSGALSAIADRTQSAASSNEAGLNNSILKPRQFGVGQRAAAHMHAAELGAAVQFREDLARIEQPVGIEGAFHAHLLI